MMAKFRVGNIIESEYHSFFKLGKIVAVLKDIYQIQWIYYESSLIEEVHIKYVDKRYKLAKHANILYGD